MASTHTQGPWTIRDYKTKTGGVWIDGGFIRNRSCGTVAEVYPLTDMDANVALIAAAPDLLEALRAVDLVLSQDPKRVGSLLMLGVHAAIAKAEGRS